VVADFHLLENGRAVVRYRDIAIGGNEDLVETARSEGGLDNVCDRSGSKNVRLNGLVAELALLLPLAVGC
jgi:hypothetical protein